jgi:integrase/recombinase XerD
MTYEFPAINRGTAHEFIQERKYLKNVTAKTLTWYEQSFKSFDGCETEPQYRQRILELRERGVAAVSVNTWLRCINAYLKWKQAPFKLPRLKEEEKILATLSPAALKAILNWRPQRSRNLLRAHLVALTILDTGLRISETLSLRKEDVNLEELSIRVFGKGGKHRLVPFSKELRARLFRYMAHHEQSYLFPTRSGTKVHCTKYGTRF